MARTGAQKSKHTHLQPIRNNQYTAGRRRPPPRPPTPNQERDYPNHGEWNTPQEAAIFFVYENQTKNKREVSRKTGMPLRSVHRVLKSGTPRRVGKLRQGPRFTISNEQVEQMIGAFEGVHIFRTASWKEIAHYYEIYNVSMWTI